MKNRYLILLILMLLAFVIYVWKYPPHECLNDINEICEKEHVDDSTYTKKYCFDDYGIEPSTLEVKLIDTMTKIYMGNQLKRINNNDSGSSDQSISDARTIWFDFKSLKTFLGHIENEVRKREVDFNIDSLGIRIYYVSYPKKELWSEYDDLKYPSIIDKAENYQSRHTLIFVPTINDTGIAYDFNPLQSNSRLHHISVNDSIMGFTVGGRTNAKNSGSLWPPDNSVIDSRRSRGENGIFFPIN